MFGGIVEATGKIIQLQRINDCLELTISPDKNFDDLSIGDSVAVNGVCLTVTDILNNKFKFTVVPETLRLTNLDFLTIGNTVNLERSLAAKSRIGGHYVQGHIDFCGQLLDLYNEGDALIAEISYPKNFGKYIVNKQKVSLLK